MAYNKKYIEKIAKEPLLPLKENERIYLNVPYMARNFAKNLHCKFDPEKKLWFTGLLNSNLRILVDLYGVNEATSKNAMQLFQDKLKDE